MAAGGEVGSTPHPLHALECSRPPAAPQTRLLSPGPAITHAIPPHAFFRKVGSVLGVSPIGQGRVRSHLPLS